MKKMKRYEGGGDIEEAVNQSEESQSIANEAKGDAMLKAMRDEAAKPKVKTVPKIAAPAATPTPDISVPKSRAATTLAPAPAVAKKDTYRDFSGNVKTRKTDADRSAEMAARRENVMSGIRSFGSSIGDMLSKAKQNYESTRPVSKQTQKDRERAAAMGNFAKGGKVSSASSRADGIAQRGKTKGTMIMCGGGYTKGKK